MINLLPIDVRDGIAYGRKNTRLLHLCLAFIFAMVGTAMVVTFGVFYINKSTNSYSTQVERTRLELERQKLPEVQKRVEEISGSLKLVNQVLSRQILFSELFKQVGAAIPAKASLSGVSISKVSGGIDLTAAAADYETATQVQVNLKDPANKIFDKADIVNIVCGAASADSKYPCTVTIRAQFAKNNPFLAIPVADGSSSK